MRKKWITALLCFGFMLFGMSISGWANTQLQEIKAYLNGAITVHVDGEIVQITDASGNETSPITYEGTTYLPIRSISGLFDVDVYYEADTRKIFLGERPQHEPVGDGTIQLVSWSDRVEDGNIIVTGSVQNQSSGRTAGIVVTGYDSNGNAIETKGSSGFMASGSVRNFSVTLDAAGIDRIEVEVAGYATDIALRSEASRVKDNELIVTGVVENGNNNGTTTGIVVIGYDKSGKAIETKSTSGFVASHSTRNYSVSLNAAAEIDHVEVKATGFADRVKLLSEADRHEDGQVIVTTVVENGYKNGITAGIVATGYDKNGHAVETKGTSGFIASGGSTRNFSVKLSAGSEIEYVEVQVTEEK